jgi:hypothetical protein
MLADSRLSVVSLWEWVSRATERGLIAVASYTRFDHISCHHEFDCRAVHSTETDLLAPARSNILADPHVVHDIFDALPPPESLFA